MTCTLYPLSPPYYGGSPIIQHLDPRQKSLLSEMLVRTTSMPVWEAQEGMTVSPNQVYVIPSDTVMTLRQNRLHLEPRGLATKIIKTVDLFFNLFGFNSPPLGAE